MYTSRAVQSQSKTACHSYVNALLFVNHNSFNKNTVFRFKYQTTTYIIETYIDMSWYLHRCACPLQLVHDIIVLGQQ